MKIGLALSGGGFRATVFHLGVLARLAEEDRLKDVSFLSTVSGGSMCAGLVYAKSGFGWPTSSHLIDEVIPEARRLLTTEDFQLGLIQRILRSILRAPWSIFETRADDFSEFLAERWGITVNLNQLREGPRWMINATCHETGKNWRFEHFWMGDYMFGYTEDTNIPLSDALAASCAIPGIVGPLVLDTTAASEWFEYPEELTPVEEPIGPDSDRRERRRLPAPKYSEVHLWDGGVYDNLGVESLHNFETGWRDGVDFLIVSDASGKGQRAEYQPGPRALLHIVTGILTDQIRSLRSRVVVERMTTDEENPGSFVRIGNTCQKVLWDAKRGGEAAELCERCLPDSEVEMAAGMETTARKLEEERFDGLFQHGFEVADYTLHAYHPDEFAYIGYASSRWGPS